MRKPIRSARNVLAIILVSPLFAERLPIQAYTTAEGLANNHVKRIRSDSRGFLWLCTDEGLSRFDGHSFTNYTVRDGLPHPWINDLLETRDGAYWVATDGGVCRYHPSGKKRFSVYRPSARPGAARINALLEGPDGDIWCGTYDGLYRMRRTPGDEVRFVREEIGSPADFYEGSLINSIFLDSRKTLWAASRSGLYRRGKGGSWERYSTLRNVPEDFFDMVSEDREGGLWAATRRRGVCSLIPDPKQSGQVISRCYSMADGLASNDIRAVYQSSDKRLWIGTADGLSELKSSAGRVSFRNYTNDNGLSGSAIYALQEDLEGNLWIGTKENGAMKMARGGLATFGAADGYRSGNFSSSIFESQKGELYVTTGDHSAVYLNAFDGMRFSAIQVKAPFGTDPLREPAMLQSRDSAWWLASAGGLFRFPPLRRLGDLTKSHAAARFTITQGALENVLLYPLYQDLEGELWFAAWWSKTGTHELFTWERAIDSVHSVSTTDAPSLKHESVTAFAEDRSGQLWIGFKEGGLVRGRPSSFTELPYLTTLSIQALHFDGAGRLWISSVGNGVTRVDDPASDLPRFRSYGIADGLSSNHVWCMTEDRFGRMYLGTGSGVDRLDPATGSISHYTTSEGLPTGAVRTAYRDRSGALWFATNSGISRLIPVPDMSLPAPVILIRALRVMGAPRPISELGETRIAGLTLPPTRNGMEIEYGTFDFSPNTRHRYQYKLDGAGYAWSPPTEQRSVNFASLAAGSYRFLVRAVNTDGVSSLQPATLEFTVMKPLWARWWFLLAMALTAGAAAYGAFRYRLAQLIELQHVRARISADLHDDVGASLSEIVILSEVARAHLDEAHPAALGPLAEITTISREAMDSIGDMVWVINPRYDRLNDLVARVRRFAGDILGARDIGLQFHGPDADEDPMLRAEFRRHFLLIAKEAVNNIAKHSGATEARIDFELHTRRLTLRVSDNGQGFDGAAGQQGNGLANIRRRTTWLRGSAELHAAPGEGTVITVIAPF
jgi:ligand-binding sensor domain-containing protein/signal transduction histidine kinase